MTASTNGTRRTTAQTVVKAGLVTAGAAALMLPFAPTATADGTGQSVPQVAERTAAPTAFTPHGSDGVLGKAPTAGDEGQAAPNPNDAQPGSGPGAAEQPRETDAAQPGDAPDGTDDQGRGAEYREDGTLVTIPREEQPEPVPASDEDIDRWIKDALEVMDEHDIPGSYDGIHRNLMRESSGDPQTINMWDTNAVQNIPSKGLLQVIDPTFEEYHVEGTPKDPYDPVANIVAACNYAADRYGSMDNVDSAY